MTYKQVSGGEWLPSRCWFVFVLALIGNMILVCFFGLSYFGLIPEARGTEASVSSTEPEGWNRPNFTSLNVRLSVRPIRPPEHLVKRTVLLPGLHIARPTVGEPTRAAVLEDDGRQRVMVLSTNGEAADGAIRAYLLYDFDLELYLPHVAGCSSERRCAQDRTPGTGGLGCVAICVVEALRQGYEAR